MKPLSPYELENARQKVFQNALDMLAEAELLFKHKRYARAYTLAHLAGEEFAKLAILYRAGLDAIRGFVVEWKTLRHRLSDHRVKLRVLALVDWRVALRDSTKKTSLTLKQHLEMVEQWNERKNLSLYVSWRDDRFMSPSEVIGEKEAKAMLELAKTRADFFVRAEATILRLSDLADNAKLFSAVDAYLRETVDPLFGREPGSQGFCKVGARGRHRGAWLRSHA